MKLKDKSVLITGGSKGIGFSIAEVLLKEGMKVAITGRDKERVDMARKELAVFSSDSQILALQSDVRNLEDQERATQQVIEYWGGIDVLIANAGVGHFASIEDLSPDLWANTIDINLTGVYNTIKPAVNALKESKGYFITIASLAGTNFFAGGAAYNASKFGLVGFTQAVMLDLRKYGVKTTTIMPGSVSTYFNNRVPSKGDAWKIQPEDIGQITLDLLKMHPRTLPSKVEVRPSMPPSK